VHANNVDSPTAQTPSAEITWPGLIYLKGAVMIYIYMYTLTCICRENEETVARTGTSHSLQEQQTLARPSLLNK